MTEQHSPTAVPLQTQSVEGITRKVKNMIRIWRRTEANKKPLPFSVLRLEEVEVRLPFVADHLAAGEAPNGDDHGGGGGVMG